MCDLCAIYGKIENITIINHGFENLKALKA